MRFKSLLALIVVVWISMFLILNWQVIAAPAKINLLFGGFETSIGVAMMAVCLPMILALIIYLGMWQSTALMESRRQAKELQTQRTLADNAEASRITELSTTLHEEIGGLEQRLQMAIETLRGELHDTERSIAATLGELDDRIQRWKDG